MKQEEASFLQGLTDLEDHEDSLYSDLKSALIDDDMYRRRIDKVRIERRRLSHLLLELQASMNESYMQACDAILELATDAESLWKKKNPLERVEMLKRLLWNRRVTGKTIEYEWRKPFEVLIRMKGSQEWGPFLDEFVTTCLVFVA